MASTGTMSDYAVHEVLDALLNDGTISIAATYLGLTTVAVTAGMNASATTEPSSWSNYARQEVTAGNWTAATARAKDNATALDFGTATVGADEDLVGWFIASTASGAGDILFYGTLDGTVTVQNGNPVTVPIGSLKVDISTALGTPA